MEKEELHYKTVVELRCLGRQMGVKCPTALRKKELIENIWQIYCGNATPYRTKMGRPHKVVEKKQLYVSKTELEEIETIVIDAVKKVIEILKHKLDN